MNEDRTHEEQGRTSGFDLSLWKRLFQFTRPHRRDLILLVLSGIGTAAFDTAFPLLTRAAIDSAHENGADAPLLAYGLGYLGCAAGLAFIAVVMVSIDLSLAAVTLSVIPIVLWVSAIFRKRILKTARVVRKTNSKITASFNEGLMGVKTSKVFVREAENLDDFRVLSTGLALAAGGFDVTAGRISIGTLIAFMAYTRQFFDPMHHIAAWFAEMQMAQASAERIVGLIDTVPEIRDSDEVRRKLLENGRSSRPDGVAEDGGPDRIETIEFRDVSFAYGDGPNVLSDFDLTVQAGETIALVGATGGGKTTIVNLLCRFYEPTAGEILIDGVDYRRRGLAWLQSSLGIVLQEPHLFSGTIAENIRYGSLHTTDAEIEAAAALVGADEFIRGLEGGYDCEVGEGGVMLSTGQKQLVSFARAILARPRILVMDEATSSVDTETEMRIQRGLEEVLRGRTSFVIAHRLSTIRNADRILVIEGGRIAEAGTHAELLAKKSRYHDLYRQQSLRETVKDVGSWAD